MKLLVTLLSVLSLNSFAQADTPVWCESLTQQLKVLENVSSTPVDLQATIVEAKARAVDLTEQNGIDVANIGVRMVGPVIGQLGGEIYGVYVEITDQGGWQQGNGMEFLFAMKKVDDKVTLSMIYGLDYWHSGSGNITEKACETQ